MKYIVVVGDGMADYPINELDGRTPLEVAEKPNMDFIAEEGRCGLLRTLKKGMPLGSDIANLRILGYDTEKYYTGGRGPLEAASIGISLGRYDIAFRCNLITVEDGRIKDHSAGHISSNEGEKLIEYINKKFGTDNIKFYPGVSYRNILVLKGKEFSDKIKCVPPHDIINQEISKNLVKPTESEGRKTAELLNKMILESKSILENHNINIKRREKGKLMANSIWFWGHGRRLEMPSFMERYGIKGAMISAVDLLRGIGVYLGMDVIDVPNITGYLDTNYEGKADFAIKALERNDLVYVHLEATDEASHEGSIEKKIKAIEDLDKRLLGRIIRGISKDMEYTLAVLTDHATPIKLRTHTHDFVPFAIYNPKNEGDKVKRFTENETKKGFYGKRDALEFMNLLLYNKSK